MKTKNLDIENLYYHKAANFQYRCDHPVAQEFDWITDQIESHGSALHFDTIVSRIQLHYAGRGPMFEIPSRSQIVSGFRKLLQKDLIEVNGEIKMVKHPVKKIPKRTVKKMQKTSRRAKKVNKSGMKNLRRRTNKKLSNRKRKNHG
jgi:hypothetical protein